MHHNRARKILELGTEVANEERFLNAEVFVPGDAFDDRIGEADEQRCRQALGAKACALGYAAGYDCGHGRRERAQEEEADKGRALRVKRFRAAGERIGADVEVKPVGDEVADREINDGRDREVDEYFDECVDLVLVTDGADLKERKAAVHREDEDRPHQQEEDVGALL